MKISTEFKWTLATGLSTWPVVFFGILLLTSDIDLAIIQASVGAITALVICTTLRLFIFKERNAN